MKVLHVLYQSLPQISGSSIRSRDILLSQKEIGIDVVAVTSPFQNSISGEKYDIIEGVKYFRTSKVIDNSISDLPKGIFSRIARLFSIVTFTIKLHRIVNRERPDLIHAHAMFYCGIPALLIGRIKKIPVVYEFRSLWMFQKKEKSKSSRDRILEKLLLKIETLTLRKADYAVFLNQNLKNYFTKLGYTFTNSIIVNNAVNTTRIETSLQKKSEVRQELVFGYIGTLTDYEGIEFLVQTFQALADSGIRNKLLIYGKGISEKRIVQAIENRKDINTIEYRGAVHPSEIFKAFDEIDIIINPRLKNEVTDSVTPLKPLEAMAYKKLFIGSDVGGIIELVTDGLNGFLFQAEDQESLINVIQRIINMPEAEIFKVVEDSYIYVIENKSWLNNSKEYRKAYKSLMK